MHTCNNSSFIMETMTYLFEPGKLLEQERKHGLRAGLWQVLHEEDLVWRREAIRARCRSTALIAGSMRVRRGRDATHGIKKMILTGKPSVARSLPLFRSWSACMKTQCRLNHQNLCSDPSKPPKGDNATWKKLVHAITPAVSFSHTSCCCILL